MQIGFSKQISENLIDEFFSLIIIKNLIKKNQLKLQNLGHFLLGQKKSRIGRNPKTKKTKHNF